MSGSVCERECAGASADKHRMCAKIDRRMRKATLLPDYSFIEEIAKKDSKNKYCQTAIVIRCRCN